MKKITFLITVLTLCFNPVSAQTVFSWDSAGVVENNQILPSLMYESISETIDGITVTLSENVQLEAWAPWGGSTGTNVIHRIADNTLPVTFEFDQAVDVHSILPLESGSRTVDYVLTPTGGSNPQVTVSIVDGFAPNQESIDLNWTNVTSFTVQVLGDNPIAYAFDDLSVTASPIPPTIFSWDSAGVVLNNQILPSLMYESISETIDGITVTLSENVQLEAWAPWGGSTGTNVIHRIADNTSPVTFVFDQPVDVHSILPLESGSRTVDYVFTPTGGNNPQVTVSLVDGFAPNQESIDLNWVNVTSFAVQVLGNNPIAYAFDNLSVTAFESLGVNDIKNSQQAIVYPNPVENSLYIKNSPDLKSIKLYNNLGQLVLQSKETIIDVSHLSKGMYFLQINSTQGTETKRIIKK